MTVMLELRPETEEVLKQKVGTDVDGLNGYIESLIERDIQRVKTLDEILAPIRKSFSESGMSEDELNELIDVERQALWDENNPKQS